LIHRREPIIDANGNQVDSGIVSFTQKVDQETAYQGQNLTSGNDPYAWTDPSQGCGFGGNPNLRYL
jgi:hypothetical protein